MNDANFNDDAKLNAFLADKGALSGLLSELKGELQDEFALPSADLDAKMMVDAQAALTLISSLPPPPPMQRNPVTRLAKSLGSANVAANDALIHGTPVHPPWPEKFWRWRVPLGVAASVLLFFPVVFQLSQESSMSTPTTKMLLEQAKPAAKQAPLPRPEAARMQDAAPTANPLGQPLPPPLANAQALLTAIEKMILNKKIPEALEAWQKFRQTYPDYVLTPAQEKHLEALKAQK